eukprot:1194253-Prorocentrum_minimum.AAC.4
MIAENGSALEVSPMASALVPREFDVRGGGPEGVPRGFTVRGTRGGGPKGVPRGFAVRGTGGGLQARYVLV